MQLINKELNIGLHSANCHRDWLSSNLQHQGMNILQPVLRTLNDLVEKHISSQMGTAAPKSFNDACDIACDPFLLPNEYTPFCNPSM